MFLYTESALEAYGDITDAQMETVLATAITSSNEAMSNSDIDLELSVVYVGPVRFRSRQFKFVPNISNSKIKHEGKKMEYHTVSTGVTLTPRRKQ